MDHNLRLRLSNAKSSLNEWYGMLNQAWKEAEELLVAMNVGKEAGVDLDIEDEPEYDHEGNLHNNPQDHWLVFWKRDKNKWGISYVRTPQGYPWDYGCGYDSKPILECSSEERVHAAHYLPALFEKVIAVAEKVSADVEQAVALIKETVAPFKRTS